MRRKEEDREIPSPSQGPSSKCRCGEEPQALIPAPAEGLCSLGEGVRKGTAWDMFSSTTHDSSAG